MPSTSGPLAGLPVRQRIIGVSVQVAVVRKLDDAETKAAMQEISKALLATSDYVYAAMRTGGTKDKAGQCAQEAANACAVHLFDAIKRQVRDIGGKLV